MESKKVLKKLDGYLFSLELTASEVEEMFYKWLEDNKIHYAEIIREKIEKIEEIEG